MSGVQFQSPPPASRREATSAGGGEVPSPMVNNGFVTYGDEESLYREMTQQDP